MIRFILASGSPRRKELLEQIGIPFVVEAAHGEEVITQTAPAQIVAELSCQKATEIAQRMIAQNRIGEDKVVIIGADTMVALQDEIMGKPKDAADAMRMLSMLQDNTHQVYTGVTLLLINKCDNGYQTVTFYEKTDVTMYPITDRAMQRYLTQGEQYPWKDKAGAYGIQDAFGAKYIKEIHGDYYNVVGLPVARLTQELMKVGIEV